MEYVVKTPIKGDKGKKIPVGSAIELDETEADQLLKAGAISDASAVVDAAKAGPTDEEAEQLLKIAEKEVEDAKKEAADATAELEKVKEQLEAADTAVKSAREEIAKLQGDLAKANNEIAKLKKPATQKASVTKK